MNCPRCKTENREGARFCRECGATFGAVCSSCGARVEPGSKFCDGCGAPLAPTPASGATPSRFDSPESYTPKRLAERILTSRSALEGERKQVTVLFADLKGSMELLADRDPEEARKILDPVLERMMEAVHRYEGTVNQVMGDGIMALFGAPLAHEDHAVRACYAALRMQAAVKRYGEEARRIAGVPVSIRVGLNSGEVVVRSIGSDLHMDYTAVGHTTHLAARMEQAALPGSILVTADTIRLAEGYVEVKPIGPVSIRGLGEPVVVYEVTGAGTVRTRLQASAARGLTRFVGRAVEVDRLRGALHRAGQGHGQLVAVVGEAGVGKSRLFHEFTHSHRTQGWLVLEASSVSYGNATSYLPVIDLLKGYFKIQDRDDHRQMREKVTGKLLALDQTLGPSVLVFQALLGVPVDDPRWQGLDPSQRRQRTLGGVKRLLVRESQVQPVLLVFEDLHWIDAETQALLDGIVEALDIARILLLVNYRPEYGHGWSSTPCYTQLRIEPLGPEDSRELLDTMLGRDTALQALKVLLIERTEGNPFFIEETVRTLAESDALAGERGAYRLRTPLSQIRVPATVQAVLASRVDRLSPEDKSLLQSAAVIGKDVSFALLAVIADLDEDRLLMSLGRLQAAELLYESALFPESEWSFRHALTHEVAYTSLLQERRRALHAQVAAALEGLHRDRLGEHAESLARHAARGEVWDKAVDYLCEAGTNAYARGALAETLERYEEAFALVSRLPPGPENLRRAIDVRLGLHLPLVMLGQIPRLVELHREAEGLARQLDDRLRLGLVAARMGFYAWLDARYVDAMEQGRRALDIARQTDDLDLRTWATCLVGETHLARGEYREAIDLLTLVVEEDWAGRSRRPLGLPVSASILACTWLADCFVEIGDFGHGLAYSDRAIDTADALDHPEGQAFAYAFRTIPLNSQGEYAQALPWCERAIRMCEAKGLVVFLPIISGLWGWALACSGRPLEGLEHIERGIALQEGFGIKTHLSSFYIWHAGALLLAGRAAEAHRAADRALELARAAGERGNQALALHRLAEISAAVHPLDTDRVSRCFEEAKMLAGAIGMRPVIAHCHLGLGTLHRHAGKRQEAQEHLTTATTMYQEMGMRLWLAQAETEMAALR